MYGRINNKLGKLILFLNFYYFKYSYVFKFYLFNIKTYEYLIYDDKNKQAFFNVLFMLVYEFDNFCF